MTSSARVVAGGRTSLETQLITGEFHRKVLFHGTPLLDHPDGVSSLLVAVHDISERMVLETTIERMRQFNEGVDGSAGEMDGETEVSLDEPLADGESFQERFEKLAADHESAMAAAAEAARDQARLQQELEHKIEQLTVAQQSAQTALAEAVETREWIQRDFEERLAAAQQPKQTSGEAPGSVSRLQRQIEEQQARLEALDTERVTTVKQLAGAMAGRFQAEARLQMFLREHDAQLKAPTDWENRIRESTERQQQLAAELEETERRVKSAHPGKPGARRPKRPPSARRRWRRWTRRRAERRRLEGELTEAASRREQLTEEVRSVQASLQASAGRETGAAGRPRGTRGRVDADSGRAIGGPGADWKKRQRQERHLEAELKDAAARHEALAAEVQTAKESLQASSHAKQQLQATLEARQEELAQVVTERSARRGGATRAAGGRAARRAGVAQASVRKQALQATRGAPAARGATRRADTGSTQQAQNNSASLPN